MPRKKKAAKKTRTRRRPSFPPLKDVEAQKQLESLETLVSSILEGRREYDRCSDRVHAERVLEPDRRFSAELEGSEN